VEEPVQDQGNDGPHDDEEAEQRQELARERDER
jgi:hypothetical protein